MQALCFQILLYIKLKEINNYKVFIKNRALKKVFIIENYVLMREILSDLGFKKINHNLF